MKKIILILITSLSLCVQAQEHEILITTPSVIKEQTHVLFAGQSNEFPCPFTEYALVNDQHTGKILLNGREVPYDSTIHGKPYLMVVTKALIPVADHEGIPSFCASLTALNAKNYDVQGFAYTKIPFSTFNQQCFSVPIQQQLPIESTSEATSLPQFSSRRKFARPLSAAVLLVSGVVLYCMPSIRLKIQQEGTQLARRFKRMRTEESVA